MQRSKKFILVAILIAVMLSGSVLGVSCSSTGGGDEKSTNAPQNGSPPGGTQPEGMAPGPGLSTDLLARVAEILGIGQQTLEDAFVQAQSEMPASMSENEQPPATSGGELPTGVPPEGIAPGPGFSTDLLARVAEILGVAQQTLEDAFAQAQSEMPGGPTGTPPEQ